ncbi:MAG: hypothetical protein QNJ69_14880 [Gammaproteobacteria bacterium]|nr:hypothetical protein [Gammaproteobacteria bacterium]
MKFYIICSAIVLAIMAVTEIEPESGHDKGPYPSSVVAAVSNQREVANQSLSHPQVRTLHSADKIPSSTLTTSRQRVAQQPSFWQGSDHEMPGGFASADADIHPDGSQLDPFCAVPDLRESCLPLLNVLELDQFCPDSISYLQLSTQHVD